MLLLLVARDPDITFSSKPILRSEPLYEHRYECLPPVSRARISRKERHACGGIEQDGVQREMVGIPGGRGSKLDLGQGAFRIHVDLSAGLHELRVLDAIDPQLRIKLLQISNTGCTLHLA